MKTKHTEGKWQILWYNYTHFATINKDVTTRICTIDVERDGFAPIEEAEANAKLIAAAPELLKVCTDLLDAFVLKENDKKGNQARTDIFKYCPEFREIAVLARHATEKATE